MADFARGQHFLELREARHLSQEDAAHGIGVSTKTIRAWEHGGKIQWPNAKKVGEFYGVDPESLVSREEAETPDLMRSLDGDPLAEVRRELRDLRVLVSAIAAKLDVDPAVVLAEAAAADAEALVEEHHETAGTPAGT